jgi:hypothetical protein
MRKLMLVAVLLSLGGCSVISERDSILTPAKSLATAVNLSRAATSPEAESVAGKVIVEVVKSSSMPLPNNYVFRERTVEPNGNFDLEMDLQIVKTSIGSRADWWVEVTNPRKFPVILEVNFKWKATYTDWYKEPPIEVSLLPGEIKRLKNCRNFTRFIGTDHGRSFSVYEKTPVLVKDSYSGAGYVTLDRVAETDKSITYKWSLPVCVIKQTVTVTCAGLSATDEFWAKSFIVKIAICDWNYNELARGETTDKSKLPSDGRFLYKIECVRVK